jgi:hypothetical protein
MAYLQSITMLVICAGSATHHALPPFSAALVRTTKKKPRQQPTGFDLSRLQKADFVPALGY